MSQSIATTISSRLAAAPPWADDQAACFRRLRLRVLRNSLAVVLATSRLRSSLVMLFSGVFWLGLFWVFFEGFSFVNRYLPVSHDLIGNVFSLFFVSLLVMLVFSSGMILYSGLFRSREAQFLLTLPCHPEQLFAYKFQEAIAFSGWGFLLLGSPMLIAYGITALAPWYYYVMFMVYLVAFMWLTGSLSAVVCLALVNHFPQRHRMLWLAALVVVAVLVVAWSLGLARETPGEVFSSVWLEGLVAKMRFSQKPLLPSQWMSAGLLAAARNQWHDAAFYGLVLLSNALVFQLMALAAARRWYRSGYSRAQGTKTSRRRLSFYALDRLLGGLLVGVQPRTRLLVFKDLRSFLRDPVQWSQFCIFLGLLALYFLNIRRFGYDVSSVYWRNIISCLNLSVTALILSTFTSRFIFPQLSLEGKKFWVLGLMPLERRSILWGKFVFAAAGSLVPAELLVVLSDLMLRVEGYMIALHMLTVWVLCLGLAAIAVGLGARLPNLNEDNPAKIAAGFGGTLSLLVSMVFIFAIVLLMAVPFHLYAASQEAKQFGLDFSQLHLRLWLAVSVVTSLVIGALATWVPLRIGIRAFEKLEL